MWERDAPDPWLPAADFLGYERAYVESGRPGDGAAEADKGDVYCTPGGNRPSRPVCHTAAMWDIFDTVDDGLDTISNRSLITIGESLDDYPDFCPGVADNHCSNEDSPAGWSGEARSNGFNNWDLYANWTQSSDPALLLNVFYQNAIQNADQD